MKFQVSKAQEGSEMGFGLGYFTIRGQLQKSELDPYLCSDFPSLPSHFWVWDQTHPQGRSLRVSKVSLASPTNTMVYLEILIHLKKNLADDRLWPPSGCRAAYKCTGHVGSRKDLLKREPQLQLVLLHIVGSQLV